MVSRQCPPSLVPALIGTLILTAPGLAQQVPDGAPAARPAPAPPAVTLVDAGAAPRRALRLSPAVGAEGGFEVTMRIAQSTQGPAVPVEAHTVTTTLSLETQVTERRTGGDIAYEFQLVGADVVEDPTVPPYILESMREALKAILGLEGSGVVSERGISKEARIVPRPGLNPALQGYVTGIEQVMHQMLTPFPEAPVGPGAVWRVESAIGTDQFTVSQESKLTLAAVDGDAVELDLTLTQSAAPQPIAIPGGAPGSMRLVSFQSKGSGRTVLRLDRLTPVSSTMTIVNDTALSIQAGQFQHEISQHSETTTELKAREKDA